MKRDAKDRKKAQPGVTKQATSQHTSPSGAAPVCLVLGYKLYGGLGGRQYIIPISQPRILRLREVK